MEIQVYENQAVTPDMEKVMPLEEYDGILFTCASSAKRFLDSVRGQWGRWKEIYSIGPKTTAYLKERGIEKVIEAGQSDYEGLADAVVSRDG